MEAHAHFPNKDKLNGQQFQTPGFDVSSISTRIPTLMELIKEARKNFRPFTEFFNTQNFKPPSPQRLSTRIFGNFVYFQSNYLCVFLILTTYALITSPIILFLLGAILYICYKVKQAQLAVKFFGRRLKTYQQYVIVNAICAPILYLAGAGAILFWSLGASAFVILLHACFYNIDAIVTEEMDGFLAEVV